MIIKRKPKESDPQANTTHIKELSISQNNQNNNPTGKLMTDSTFQNLTLKNSSSASSLANFQPVSLSKKIDFSNAEKKIQASFEDAVCAKMVDSSKTLQYDKLVFSKSQNQDQDSSNVSTTTVKKIMKSSLDQQIIPEKKFHNVTPSIKHKTIDEHPRTDPSDELRKITKEYTETVKLQGS